MVKKEEIRRLKVQEGGLRVDKYLSSYEEDLSRSFVQKLIREGRVQVEGQEIKPSYQLQKGQEIEVIIPPPRPLELIPQNIPLDIVYEDQWLIIINKPPGLVVHPAPGHPDGTLVNALLYHCGEDLQDIGGRLRPGIVHRLDRDTSGIMVVAKTGSAHSRLVESFKNREVEKTYLALVLGQPDRKEKWIDLPIGRHPRNRKKMTCNAYRGREARTFLRVLGEANKNAFLELKPHTGRTHQLRVHLAFTGTPILGDRVYARAPAATAAPRQMLHSFRLQLPHPFEGEKKEFSASPPADFQLTAREVGLEQYLNQEGDNHGLFF